MPRALASLVLLCGLCNTAWGTDWPTAAHDASRSGRTTDRVSPPFRVRWAKAWQYENIATVAQLIVADGRGFIGTLGRDGSLAGKVHCVDVRDGRDVWVFDTLQGGVAHTLTWSPQSGGTVYAATTAGEVVALEAATGKQRWKFQTPLGGFVVNPCVVAGAVLLGSRQGVFYAINETDGTLRWQRDLRLPICHTAAAADGVVYFMDEGMHPHALDIQTGKVAESWVARQLPGGSARFYWPVILKDHVLMTVAPPHRYNWSTSDNILFKVPEVKDRKQGDRYAVGTAEQEAKEQANVIAFLKEQPANQVIHCLTRKNGRPACTPGVLYTGGSGSECTPPVLDQEGRAIVEYRSWYSLWDSPSWVNPYSSLGTLDPVTGVVSQLRPQLDAKRVPWGHVWIIADESSAFTVAGDQLLVAHQGNFGGFDITTARTYAGVGKRDTWGGYPPLSWNRQEWHGGPRSALTVVDNSVYYVVGGRVIACEGNSQRGSPAVEPVVVAAVEKMKEITFDTPVREPTTDEIWKIFTEYHSRQRVIDFDQTAALQTSLAKQVTEILEYRVHAPFVEWRGIAPTTVSQATFAEIVYALCLALPHLEPQQKQQVEAYLLARLKTHGLEGANTSMSPEKRNYHALDQWDDGSSAKALFPNSRIDRLMVDLLLREVVEKQEEPFRLDIRDLPFPGRQDAALLRPAVLEAPPTEVTQIAESCRELTSLAGLIRREVRREKNRGTKEPLMNFHQKLTPYLAHYRQVGRECAKQIDSLPGDDQHPSAGGQFRNLGGPYVGNMHMAAIVYWTDLCPELGSIIREFAPDETAAIKAWMLRNTQGFYLTRWDTPVQEGEVPCPLYLTTQNYFHFFSSVADVDFATHKLLVDMPACHADVYYIERLVHAIEASARR